MSSASDPSPSRYARSVAYEMLTAKYTLAVEGFLREEYRDKEIRIVDSENAGQITPAPRDGYHWA